jgi:tetratricopeptide (TPR) repeat protein
MNNQLEEAIVIQEDLLNNLEQIDFSSLNDQWKILYFTTINNLILSYKNNNFSEKAMKICKKVLNKIESCYEINHSNWVKLYLVTLNSIAHIYYDNDQIDIALGLLEKNFEISKKEYEKDTVFKHMFIECSFNIMSMYYEVDRMEEAVKKYVILKNIFESEKMIDNELFIRANKLMNQNTFIKHNVNLEILLFIATAIALRKKKNVVDVEDFFYSLSFVQFNKTIKILFYKIFGIENMQNLKLEQGSVAVHLMNNALNNQTLKYSKQLVDLKCYLEKKIGNEIIGVFYEKKI